MDKKNYISRNDLIIFRNTFNEPINDYLEIINTHKTIYFGKSFNSDISLIPENITTIIFDPDSLFDKEIKDLHFGVIKIVFGNNFNQRLEYLPDGIEELEFNPESIFNSDLSNLPSSIKKITLGSNYNLPLNCLPSGLEYLKICSSYNQKIQVFPNNLRYLFFYKFNIDRYTFGDFNNDDEKIKKYSYDWKITNLPQNLIEIRYPNNYLYLIEKIHESTKIIHLPSNYKFINNLKNNYPNIKIYEYPNV